MTIIDEYLNLTSKYKSEYGDKTLVLLQVGSFFECYAIVNNNSEYIGSNIQDFADINDFVISRKNTSHKGQPVVMAGFGINQLEKYVRRLQENNYTIVVYTQDTNTKNTTRSLSCIYSPGTFFSNDSTILSNVVSCFWIEYTASNQLYSEKISIGMSSVDIFTGSTNINFYSIDFIKGPSIFDELENYIYVNNPSECIIISNLDEKHTLLDYIIDLLNCKYHIHNYDNSEIKNVSKQRFQNEIFTSFFNKQIFDEYNLSTQSFCYLIQFLYKHNPNLIKKIMIPLQFSCESKLILANHSLKQLNIISDCRYSGKFSSVLNLLNNCITNIGKRSFNNQFLNPITNIDKLNNIYDVTEHTISTNIWENIRNYLNKIKDLSKIYRKIILGKLSPRDLFSFYNSINVINEIYIILIDDLTISNYIGNENIIYSINNIKDFLSDYLNLESCSKFEDISFDKMNINNIYDYKLFNNNHFEKIDSLLTSFNEYKFKFEYIRSFLDNTIKNHESNTKTKGTTTRTIKEKNDNNTILKETTIKKKIITQKTENIEPENNEIDISENNDYIKIHETPKSEAILIGTTRRVNVIKQVVNELSSNYFDISNLQFKSHNGSNSMITSDEIEIISRKIFKLKEEFYNELIKEFTSFCSTFIDKYEKDILKIIDYISECDLLQNRCYIATKYKYCKPIIQNNNDKSFINFTELRHPLIEKINTNELYVTNDLTIGQNIDGYLLYGTNAVGKTSFIKSIGISIVMAQSGLYVPAETFIYFPYNKLFTRILGNDNLFKGLSTFAVEMSELRTILKYSSSNSLVLGDELCSGTESTSALSIFTTGIRFLADKEVSFLFATHFHEILNYTEIKEITNITCKHLSVFYDKTSGELIYDRKLKDGSGDNMYGLEVCKSLNLPQDFLEYANNIRIKYNKPAKYIISNNKSHYNADKIKNICEICCELPGTEIHHLIQQKDSELSNFNKANINHKANLINICEDCHDKIHSKNIKYQITKVGDTYKLLSS